MTVKVTNFEEQLLNSLLQVNNNITIMTKTMSNLQNVLSQFIVYQKNKNKETNNKNKNTENKNSDITNKISTNNKTSKTLDNNKISTNDTSKSTVKPKAVKKMTFKKTKDKKDSIEKNLNSDEKTSDKLSEKKVSEKDKNVIEISQPIISLDSEDEIEKLPKNPIPRSKSASTHNLYHPPPKKTFNNSLLHRSKSVFKSGGLRNNSSNILDRLLPKKNRKDKNNNFNRNKILHFNDHIFLGNNNRIRINVGGIIFETTYNTLSNDNNNNMLSAMFSGRYKLEMDKHRNNSHFIDRDPTHFRHILNYLRDGIDYLKHGGLLSQSECIINELLQEAKYYNLIPLVNYISKYQLKKNKKLGDELTNEKQYKLITNVDINKLELIFNQITSNDGYDFENWIYIPPYKLSRNEITKPKIHILFSKKLSKAEVRLLDRLTNIDLN